MLSFYENMTDFFRPAGSAMPSPMNRLVSLLQFVCVPLNVISLVCDAVGSSTFSDQYSAPTLLQFRRTVQLTRSARNGGAEHVR